MPLKICFVLENFYPAHRAGTETYVLNLAKGLINKGWEVTVIIAAVGRASEKYTFEEMEVFALSVPQKISTAELNGFKEPSNLREFKQLLEKIQPQIVHFHSFSRSFTHFHLKLAYDWGAKVFFTAHLGGIFCARGDLQLFGKQQCNAKVMNWRCSACYASQKHHHVVAYAAALAGSIKALRKHKPALNLISNKLQSLHYLKQYTHANIAIARWIEQAFHVNGIQNTQLITQAIDTSKFLPKTELTVGEKIRLGFIGRMNPSKGFYLLMEALESLHEFFDLHCITIYDPSEPDYYRRMKEKFFQLGYSQWQENISHETINMAMDYWDLLVLPSHHEVAPLSILEAFAKSIPVLGSDYPAIAEMIQDGYNGLIFKNKDAGHLIEKLKMLAEQRQVLESLAKQITQVKDISTLVEEYYRLYVPINPSPHQQINNL